VAYYRGEGSCGVARCRRGRESCGAQEGMIERQWKNETLATFYMNERSLVENGSTGPCRGPMGFSIRVVGISNPPLVLVIINGGC
jgi:hypothetical protein